MGMRTDCKHYESRTYASGETVRKCRLDLAPEAPWRCPEDCPRFARRMVDVGWNYGSLAPTTRAPGPVGPEVGDDAAALLDAAEDIVNEAGRELRAELAQPRSRKLFRKRKKRRR